MHAPFRSLTLRMPTSFFCFFHVSGFFLLNFRCQHARAEQCNSNGQCNLFQEPGVPSNAGKASITYRQPDPTRHNLEDDLNVGTGHQIQDPKAAGSALKHLHPPPPPTSYWPRDGFAFSLQLVEV